MAAFVEENVHSKNMKLILAIYSGLTNEKDNKYYKLADDLDAFVLSSL
jgi:hypothetical protein